LGFVLYIESLLTYTLPSLLIHQQRSDFLTSGLENAKNMDVGGCSANFSIIRMNTRLQNKTIPCLWIGWIDVVAPESYLTLF